MAATQQGASRDLHGICMLNTTVRSPALLLQAWERGWSAHAPGPESVQTPKEVYEALTGAGWRVDYLRLPQVAAGLHTAC